MCVSVYRGTGSMTISGRFRYTLCVYLSSSDSEMKDIVCGRKKERKFLLWTRKTAGQFFQKRTWPLARRVIKSHLGLYDAALFHLLMVLSFLSKGFLSRSLCVENGNDPRERDGRLFILWKLPRATLGSPDWSAKRASSSCPAGLVFLCVMFELASCVALVHTKVGLLSSLNNLNLPEVKKRKKVLDNDETVSFLAENRQDFLTCLPQFHSFFFFFGGDFCWLYDLWRELQSVQTRRFWLLTQSSTHARISNSAKYSKFFILSCLFSFHSSW